MGSNDGCRQGEWGQVSTKISKWPPRSGGLELYMIMYGAFVLGGLLVPLALLVMGAPYPYYILFAGTVASTVETVRMGIFPRLFGSWMPVSGVMIWILCNRLRGWSDEENVMPAKMAFLLVAYGLPTGLAIQRRFQEIGETWSLIVLIAMAAGLGFTSMTVARSGGTQIEMQQMAGGLSRYTVEGVDVEYWRFFVAGNFMMRCFLFGIFGQALLILLLMRVKWYLLAASMVAIALGSYAPIQMVTRTGFLGGSLSTIIVGIFVFLKKGSRFKGGYAGVVLLGLPVLALLSYPALSSIPEVDLILERMKAAGSDSRIDLWLESIDCISKRPLGGGFEQMVTLPWAHNLILDFMLTNGLFGLVSIILILAPAIKNLLLLIQQPKAMKNPVVVYMINLFVSSIIIQMICPPNNEMLAIGIIFSTMAAGYLADFKAARFSPIPAVWKVGTWGASPAQVHSPSMPFGA